MKDAERTKVSSPRLVHRHAERVEVLSVEREAELEQTSTPSRFSNHDETRSYALASCVPRK